MFRTAARGARLTLLGGAGCGAAAFAASYAEQYWRLTTAPFRPGATASEAPQTGHTISERCLETCVMSVLGLYSKFAMQVCNTTHFDNDQVLRRLIAEGGPGRQGRGLVTPALLPTDFQIDTRKPRFSRVTSARARARLLARRSSPERGSSLLPRLASDQWLQIAALARTNSRYPAPSVAKYQKRAAGGWCHWRAAEACRRPGKPHPSIPSWRSSAASPSSLPGTLEVKASGKTFAHTLLVPSTCPRPRPPPSPSSPVAGARVARPRSPPEAQGVRETRPEAPLFCRLRPPLLPNQPQPRGERRRPVPCLSGPAPALPAP